jgi:hypothetical protein
VFQWPMNGYPSALADASCDRTTISANWIVLRRGGFAPHLSFCRRSRGNGWRGKSLLPNRLRRCWRVAVVPSFGVPVVQNLLRQRVSGISSRKREITKERNHEQGDSWIGARCRSRSVIPNRDPHFKPEFWATLGFRAEGNVRKSCLPHERPNRPCHIASNSFEKLGEK